MYPGFVHRDYGTKITEHAIDSTESYVIQPGAHNGLRHRPSSAVLYSRTEILIHFWWIDCFEGRPNC